MTDLAGHVVADARLLEEIDRCIRAQDGTLRRELDIEVLTKSRGVVVTNRLRHGADRSGILRRAWGWRVPQGCGMHKVRKLTTSCHAGSSAPPTFAFPIASMTGLVWASSLATSPSF